MTSRESNGHTGEHRARIIGCINCPRRPWSYVDAVSEVWQADNCGPVDAKTRSEFRVEWAGVIVNDD